MLFKSLLSDTGACRMSCQLRPPVKYDDCLAHGQPAVSGSTGSFVIELSTLMTILLNRRQCVETR